MSDPPGPPGSAPATDLNAITLRFFGLLLVLGGVVVSGIGIAIRQFPTAVREGERIFVFPEGAGRHGLDSVGTVVLIATGGVLAVSGAASLLAGRLSSSGSRMRPALVPARARPARSRRPVRTLMLGAATLAAVLVVRWVASRQ